MKLQKLAGATSEIWQIFIADSSSTTGAGLTGLAFNTASLTAYYHRDTDTTATAISLVTMTVGTFTSSGFKEIDATNMPGWYQLCPPNAALASGAKSVGIHLKGATNMAPLPIEVQLTAVNPDSATAFITSVATVTTVTNQLTAAQIATGVWQDATAGDFTAASSIGKSLYTSGTVPGAANGLVIAGSNAATTFATLTSTGAFSINGTSNVAQTGDSFARIGAAGAGLTALGDTRIANLDATVTSRMATYTQPTGFLAATFPGTVASTTNITAGTITTATNVTTVNGLAAGVITASSIAAAALNGKGDWNTTTPPTVAAIATGIWQDTTAGDFTVANSVGKSLMNGVALGTGLTVNDITTKTGYRLDATGSAAFTESYAADGAAATLPQLLYMTLAMLSEFSISGTTLTAKKLDGSTTAGTFTLNDASNPTAITRAT